MSVLKIPEFAYHTDQLGDDRPSLSRSVIQKLIEKTPAHARAAHPKLNPLYEVETKVAFDVGTVCHQLLLDGAAGVQVVNYDDWRTKAAKEEAATARAHGLIPLLEKDWVQVEAMMAAVREQLDGRGLFEDGESELTLVWEERGVLCRARLDWLTTDRQAIHDFKTSTNPEPGKFSRGSFFDHGYDLQAAFYMRGVRACFGTDADVRFAVAEKEAPYLLAVFGVPPHVLHLANRKIDWALDTWRECLATDTWPGYPEDVCWVDLRPWDEAQWAEREARAQVAA